MRWKCCVVPVLVVLCSGCSSSQEIASRWHAGDRNARWTDSTVLIADANVAMGVRNDAEYLYLTLAVGDRRLQRQVFGRGLTVWFDYDGGKEQRFGVRYPIGIGTMTPEDRPMRDRRARDTSRPVPQLDTSFAFPERLPTEMELYGPMPGERHRTSTTEVRGVEVRVDDQNGMMYYRLQVPLMDNGPHVYAIGTRPGSRIGIGIESGGFGPRGEGGGVRMGGGSGARRGGGMRRPGEFGGQRSEPLSVWVAVHLAAR